MPAQLSQLVCSPTLIIIVVYLHCTNYLGRISVEKLLSGGKLLHTALVYLSSPYYRFGRLTTNTRTGRFPDRGGSNQRRRRRTLQRFGRDARVSSASLLLLLQRVDVTHDGSFRSQALTQRRQRRRLTDIKNLERQKNIKEFESFILFLPILCSFGLFRPKLHT